ncbi:cupin-like domain-containing protein [Thalassotalea ponticola]|uniref:cupin-like domain-containing protein n=1 Tax=Thalassotalea ponticola TaxID=1523392 RepID=UPI0025B612C7|nr:cupin-like domain-containing protein [Thalassotalea ponticola]MDN3651596.1 cupin-like domain-containing protein [Thalassotalea ponticola]
MLNIDTQVKQITGVTAKNIPQFVIESDQPLLLKGFADDWPIVKEGLKSASAACAYIEQFYQGKAVNACYGDVSTKGRVFYNDSLDGFNYRAAKVDLKPVLAKLLQHIDDPSPPTMYVGSTEVSHFLPGFKEQHPISIDCHKPLTSIWIGNQSKIAAHYDFPLNIACNVVGKRRFTLFPPEQVKNLYTGPMEFAPGGQDISMVDFDNPDFAKFPKFETALAHAQVAELDPGDALFLPSMWWHHVEGLSGLNILVTHWWRDTPAYMGRPHNALLLAMLNLRNLPYAQRQAWKSIFEHYIFDHQEQDSAHLPEDAQGMLKTPMDELTARKIRAQLLEKLKR